MRVRDHVQKVPEVLERGQGSGDRIAPELDAFREKSGSRQTQYRGGYHRAAVGDFFQAHLEALAT